MDTKDKLIEKQKLLICQYELIAPILLKPEYEVFTRERSEIAALEKQVEEQEEDNKYCNCKDEGWIRKKGEMICRCCLKPINPNLYLL